MGAKLPDLFAKIISIVFHPVFCPPIAVLLFCGNCPEKWDWFDFSFLILSAIPIAATKVYFDIKGIKDIYQLEIRYRKIPFFINFVVIGLFRLFLVQRGELHSFAGKFLLAYGLVNLAGFIVTLGFRYKISLHLMAWGGMLGLAAGLHPETSNLFPFFFLAPISLLVYWARIRIKSHSHDQVSMGAATGFALCFLSLWIFG